MDISSSSTQYEVNERRMVHWKYVPEYDVEVCREGLVRRNAKALRIAPSHHGYRRVRLGRRVVYLHQIVALAFCEQPKGCGFVDHVDGNPTNNAPENLEWVTNAENLRRYHEQRRIKEAPRCDKAIQEPALERLLAGLKEMFEDLRPADDYLEQDT